MLALTFVAVLAMTAVPPADESEATHAAAADASATPALFQIRELDFGVQRPDSNTNSSRFREYRALKDGFVFPSFRFAGNEKFYFDARGDNVLQDDAHYSALLEPWSMRITGDFVKIPHRFGNDARSILLKTSGDTFSLSSTFRQSIQNAVRDQFVLRPAGINFDFLNGLVAPALQATPTFDLSLSRERGQLDLDLVRDKPYRIRLSYFNEIRRGDRAAGTAFGFSNVVETPEPIDYKTQDFRVTGEWGGSWGLVRGGVGYNRFTNSIPAQYFANPFRATDATDASAYTAPGSGSIGGAALGRVSLPPSNDAVTGTVGVIAKFAGNTRVTADAVLGEWKQNDPFMAFTTNTAVVLPDGRPGASLAALPASSLDGKMRSLSISGSVTSRPVDHLHLTARFRRYDLDNKTARISFPEGYVRFDAVWEAIPRISVPYGYTTDRAEASAAYDFGNVTVEGGYRLEKWDRTFRETRKTTQKLYYGKADVRVSDWAVLRATYEKGTRDFDELEIEASEDAAFLSPGAPANLLAVPSNTRQTTGQPLCPAGTVCNLRYDQAEKDIQRFGGHLELSPGGKATITLSYLKGKDDYTKTTFGLVNADNESISAEVDYTPTDRFNIFAFYTKENLSTFQGGRQSGATVSINPLDEWTADIKDKVDTFGGGANFNLVKEKLDLKVYGTYQKLDGNNDLFSPPGGTPDVAFNIPLFDDTKLLTVSAELAYRVTKAWRLAVGGFFDDYKLQDSNTSDLPNYVPGSFFLSPNDADYKGHVIYVRATYVW